MTVFLGLLEIEGGKKDAVVIFDLLINHLRNWGLDLCKFVAFGSDGASTMVGSHGGVATRLKNKVSHSFYLVIVLLIGLIWLRLMHLRR